MCHEIFLQSCVIQPSLPLPGPHEHSMDAQGLNTWPLQYVIFFSGPLTQLTFCSPLAAWSCAFVPPSCSISAADFITLMNELTQVLYGCPGARHTASQICYLILWSFNLMNVLFPSTWLVMCWPHFYKVSTWYCSPNLLCLQLKSLNSAAINLEPFYSTDFWHSYITNHCWFLEWST